jgi:hypothetical protein
MSDTSHIYRALTEPLPVHRDGQVIAHPSERAVLHTREQIDLGHKHPALIAALIGTTPPEATDDDVKRPIDLGVKRPALLAALLGTPEADDDVDEPDDDLPPAA